MASKGAKRLKLIGLLLVNIFSFVAVSSFIQSQEIPAPDIRMINFDYKPNFFPTIECPNHLVEVRGTVFNAGTKALNVTVVIDIIVTTNTKLQTEAISLGDIPESGAISFNRTFSYPSSPTYTFSTVQYGLLWTSERSGFMMDALLLTAISLTALIFLLIFDIFSAHKLGFFMWLKNNMKTVGVTIAWSTIVAAILSKSYWLTYAGNPLLFKFGIAWTGIVEWIPKLSILDVVLIFAVSVIAGAILLDIETSIYSLLANYILSFALTAIYVVLFIWFSLGYSEIFASTGGFLEWGSFIAYIASRVVFRLTFPIVQIFCLFGVLAGTYLRGILQPSAETYMHVKSPDFGNGNEVGARQNRKLLEESTKAEKTNKATKDRSII
jgi:hypothetical protein